MSTHKAIAVLHKLITAFPEFDTDEPINGSDAVDTLASLWDEIKDAVSDNVLLPVGTQVICSGIVDVIEKHVEPGTENYLQGYRYELKEHGTQSPGMVTKYNPDNVQL